MLFTDFETTKLVNFQKFFSHTASYDTKWHSVTSHALDILENFSKFLLETKQKERKKKKYVIY